MSSINDKHRGALLSPALSRDNTLLAIVTPEAALLIINLKDSCVVHELQLPRSAKLAMPKGTLIQWAPEAIREHNESSDLVETRLKAWILLSSDNRLIVLEVQVPEYGRPSLSAPPSSARVLYDYEFELQYGKLVLAEFVFSHSYALLTFEMNTHASLISFAKPQRDDILSPKFPDHNGFVQSPQQKHFALLLRTKGQDQVAVFTTRNGSADNAVTFLPGTVDAQGVKWAPGDDPVIAVWDSAAHGPRVLFFTALGHSLKKLILEPYDIVVNSFRPEESALGITRLSWANKSGRKTLLACVIGSRYLLARVQDERSMVVSEKTIYDHQPVVDGVQTAIWQQRDDEFFHNETATIDLQITASSEINAVEINADASMMATRIDGLSNVVWIWELENIYPAALLMFHHDIRRLVWHPRAANILAIILNDKMPHIYLWHNLNNHPKRVPLPFETSIPTGKLHIRWMQLPDVTFCPLLISYKKQFDVGLLRTNDHKQFEFQSVLHQQNVIDSLDDESSLINTPSKSNNVARTGSRNLNPNQNSFGDIWDNHGL